MKKPITYFRLLVAVQAVMLLAVILARSFHPERARVARVVAAFSDINGGLKTALGMFEVDNGRYPTTQEGLRILVELPVDGSLTNWHGPYLDPPGVRLDPWGHEYGYRYPGIYNPNGYDLYSLGPDGVSETSGNDPDDIRNWSSPSIGGKSERVVYHRTLSESANEFLLYIPLLFLANVLAQIISPRYRALAMKDRWVDWVWVALVVIAILILITPRVHG